MESLITLMTKHFWLMAILISFVNMAIFKKRILEHTSEKPELKEGYEKLIKGYMIYGNIPLVVMGIGCTIGKIPNVFEFFRPKSGNIYVLAFFAAIFLEWILGVYWLFFKNGAQMLVDYPGMFRTDFKSPRAVKIFFLACLAGGIFAVVLMFKMDIPSFPNK